MSDVNDFYYLQLDREGDAFHSYAALRPILERLDASFLPKPQKLEATSEREATVEGLLDPRVRKTIDKGRAYMGLKGPGVSCSLGFSKNKSWLTIFFRLDTDAGAVRALFVNLCHLFSPLYGSVGPHNKDQEIYDAHYARARRTFYASGFFWLNFFGPEEEARQGGPALADNPCARATRFPNGLLLEVGESGLDAFTPEGERRLLDATRAMPPLPPSRWSLRRRPLRWKRSARPRPSSSWPAYAASSIPKTTASGCPSTSTRRTRSTRARSSRSRRSPARASPR